MRGRVSVFLGSVQFLGQLLAGADAGDANGNVGTGPPATKPNKAFGQGSDTDRLAHVEHEDFAAVSKRSGLQDELYRFWDRHEEAGHARVCDGDWPTLRDLVEK